MTVSAVGAFVGIVIYSAMKQRVKMFLEDERESTITMDENGVEINKGNSQIMRLAWDNVAFVRSFNESTSFFARDASGIVISVTNKYKDKILGYIENEKIDVDVI